MNFDYYMFLLIFFLWNYCFFLNFKYLLINLLSIEFMMLSLLMNIFMNLMIYNHEMFFMMVFLSFMVCEGVLGLSLLISMIRILGNSNIQLMNLLKI